MPARAASPQSPAPPAGPVAPRRRPLHGSIVRAPPAYPSRTVSQWAAKSKYAESPMVVDPRRLANHRLAITNACRASRPAARHDVFLMLRRGHEKHGHGLTYSIMHL